MNIFSALRSTPSGIIDINLTSCVLNRHKLRQSQIATLPSQFVICRNLWSKPWRHKLSPITLKTCSGYLVECPSSFVTWIWKVVFLPILVLFYWFICLCVCISVKKLIIVVPRKPSWKGPILMWICFLNLGVYPRLLLISIWEVVFWTVTSQFATNQVSLPSQFMICRNLWSRACRGKFSPITLKMCSAYLEEYPCSLWTGIWEVVFWPISVLFAVSIVYNSPYMGCRNEPKGCV